MRDAMKKPEGVVQWVKPLSGQRAEARPHHWQLERFDVQARQEQDALEERLLERMRDRLMPRLEAEMAELKARAREEGWAEGHQAGYEAGFQAGREAGEQAAQEALEARLAQWQAEVLALVEALQHPFTALEEQIAGLMGQILSEALALLVETAPALQVQIVQTGLRKVLRQLHDHSVPIEVRAHPSMAEALSTLLPDTVTLRQDPGLPEGQVQVHQAETWADIDWQTPLQDLCRQLREKMTASRPASTALSGEKGHDPSIDTASDPATAPADA